MGRPAVTGFLSFTSLILLAGVVHAAEITEVVDAFDEDNDNPFDLHLEPMFRQTRETGVIAREAPCSAGPRCTEDSIVFQRELDYERIVSTLDIQLAMGLYKDLEVHATLPFILSDQRTLRFAKGVSRANSSAFPTDVAVQDDLANRGTFDTYQFFSLDPLENVGLDRSGLGDATIGIAYSPFNDSLQPWAATLTLGFDYTMPSGTVATRKNDGAGRGVHELEFSIAASKRFRFLDPYFRVGYVLPVATDGSLFKKIAPAQSLVEPGQRAELLAGTEIVLFPPTREKEVDQKYVLDLGFAFSYTAEGRDYGPLFDALGRSSCNGTTPLEAGMINTASGDAQRSPDGRPYEPATDTTTQGAACAWIVQQPGNSSEFRNRADQSAVEYFHDGITDIEGFTSVGGHLGLYAQFSRYFELRLRTAFETQSNHFLTAARTGTSADDDNEVDLNWLNGERNPMYNPTIDGVGRRFRLEGAFNFSWDITAAIQF